MLKNKINYENICFSYVKHMENENENININDINIIKEYINNNKLDNIIKLLIEYLEYRRSIKLSVNNTVIEELLESLKSYNKEEQEKIIKKALKGGWKDFYPPERKKESSESQRRVF